MHNATYYCFSSVPRPTCLCMCFIASQHTPSQFRLQQYTTPTAYLSSCFFAVRMNRPPPPPYENQVGQEWLDDVLRFRVTRYGKQHLLSASDYAGSPASRDAVVARDVTMSLSNPVAQGWLWAICILAVPPLTVRAPWVLSAVALLFRLC